MSFTIESAQERFLKRSTSEFLSIKDIMSILGSTSERIRKILSQFPGEDIHRMTRSNNELAVRFVSDIIAEKFFFLVKPQAEEVPKDGKIRKKGTNSEEGIGREAIRNILINNGVHTGDLHIAWTTLQKEHIEWFGPPIRNSVRRKIQGKYQEQVLTRLTYLLESKKTKPTRASKVPLYPSKYNRYLSTL